MGTSRVAELNVDTRLSVALPLLSHTVAEKLEEGGGGKRGIGYWCWSGAAIDYSIGNPSLYKPIVWDRQLMYTFR